MRLMKLAPAILFLVSLFAITATAQLRTRTTSKSVPPPVSDEVKASGAYAEIVLRKTELKSELEEYLVSYTDEFPKVKHTRYEIGLLEAELIRFGKLKSSDAARLTLALGKLIVRRATLATDYWILSNKYNSAHPDAKKAKRKLEIYDRAVEDIL